jgi:hypothetical protein
MPGESGALMGASDKPLPGQRGMLGVPDPPPRAPHLPLSTTPLLDAAIMYSRRGWRVLPLHNVVATGCSCGNSQCGKSIAKHPYIFNWNQLATTDEKQLREWWGMWPLANIGVATGAASGIIVLDVDVHRDKKGFESLAKLEKELGPLPKTLIQRTGAGGRHLIFRHPRITFRNSTCWRGANGIDWRSDGGQILVAPSIAAAGQYDWINLANVAELPQRWLDAHRESEAQRGAPKSAPKTNHTTAICTNHTTTSCAPPTAEELAEDERILGLAFGGNNRAKFETLWAGEWQRAWKGKPMMYPSQSEADAALCQILAFWSNGNAARIDRLFRRSGLYREKWERQDYRDRTVERAISFEYRRSAEPDEFSKLLSQVCIRRPPKRRRDDLHQPKQHAEWRDQLSKLKGNNR